MRPLYDDTYYSAFIDLEAERIEMVRSSVPFPGLPAVLTTLEGFMAKVRDAHAERFALLVDSTAAPTPAGPKYEKGFSTLAKFLATHFERIAVVVSSREAALREIEVAPGDNVDFFTNCAAARNALSQPAVGNPEL